MGRTDPRAVIQDQLPFFDKSPKKQFPIGSCTIRSHGTKSHMVVSKLQSGTSKTKSSLFGLVRVALFWKFHCATCSPPCVILYHVTGSCKGPILTQKSQNVE